MTRSIFPRFHCEIGAGLWHSDMLNAWARGPLDVSRAEKELGFVAQFDLERGMRELAAWEQKHPEELENWPKNELWLLPQA